mmetsp:Transcript_43578/g.42079  ORF Transcript_43578/g.42079 Transcript_43578/m.42079 type:complete len:230 (+) Transcript_43578:847-1536(+)
MRPQLYHVIFVPDGLWRGFGDSLEDLADISQVVGVMRLGWGGSEPFEDGFVGHEGGRDEAVLHVLDRLGVGGVRVRDEEPLHDIGEYMGQALMGVRLNIEHIKVPDVSGGDVISASSWGAHGRDELDGLDVSELPLLGVDVVPPAVVHPLPQELDRRLSPVDFLLGHVQIVHKDHSLLAQRRPIDALPPLLSLPINDPLRLIGTGLCGEGETDVGVLFALEGVVEFAGH